MITHTDHVARLHLTHKEWSFTPADDPELSELGFGCMAHAAATSSSQETEASHDDWFRRILAQDAARVDALLGLLISMMADAEAKGELISTEEAEQLLQRNMRLTSGGGTAGAAALSTSTWTPWQPSGLSLGSLSQPGPPALMEIAQPGYPPALSPPHTRQSHSQNSSSLFPSSSAPSDAEPVRPSPSCNGDSYHSAESDQSHPSLDEWLPRGP
ncbi:g508 [Coccomyxa viridis]|uniref:G508 protein n=1 Tax=Coccomyxa viridis TaxID=1274662 RepID=A0ABP1FHH4_9CHLO